jgi:hypothetical protein
MFECRAGRYAGRIHATLPPLRDKSAKFSHPLGGWAKFAAGIFFRLGIACELCEKGQHLSLP